MDALTEIIKQLADLGGEIYSLPDDAFAEKYELMKKRDVLREKASQYSVDVDKGRSTEELLAELAAMRTQLKQIDDQRIDLVLQSGGGSQSGPSSLGGISLNTQISESAGAGRLHTRIAAIKSVLSDRDVEIPEEL